MNKSISMRQAKQNIPELWYCPTCWRPGAEPTSPAVLLRRQIWVWSLDVRPRERPVATGKLTMRDKASSGSRAALTVNAINGESATTCPSNAEFSTGRPVIHQTALQHEFHHVVHAQTLLLKRSRQSLLGAEGLLLGN